MMSGEPFDTHTLATQAVAHIAGRAYIVTSARFTSAFRLAPKAGLAALAAPALRVATVKQVTASVNACPLRIFAVPQLTRMICNVRSAHRKARRYTDTADIRRPALSAIRRSRRRTLRNDRQCIRVDIACKRTRPHCRRNYRLCHK